MTHAKLRSRPSEAVVKATPEELSLLAERHPVPPATDSRCYPSLSDGVPRSDCTEVLPRTAGG